MCSESKDFSRLVVTNAWSFHCDMYDRCNKAFISFFSFFFFVFFLLFTKRFQGFTSVCGWLKTCSFASTSIVFSSSFISKSRCWRSLASNKDESESRIKVDTVIGVQENACNLCALKVVWKNIQVQWKLYRFTNRSRCRRIVLLFSRRLRYDRSYALENEDLSHRNQPSADYLRLLFQESAFLSVP